MAFSMKKLLCIAFVIAPSLCVIASYFSWRCSHNPSSIIQAALIADCTKDYAPANFCESAHYLTQSDAKIIRSGIDEEGIHWGNVSLNGRFYQVRQQKDGRWRSEEIKHP